MNTNKLSELIASSKLTKFQIAEKCNVSRTTLDNVLAGADAKISTVESLAKVLNVPVGYLFDDAVLSVNSENENLIIENYKREIERLQTLLNKQKRSTKVVVELDVDDNEFVKMGLKDKVIQILNR